MKNIRNFSVIAHIDFVENDLIRSIGKIINLDDKKSL